MTKCPCENCICIPICRNRFYLDLVDKCELVSSYLRTPCDASKKRNRPVTVLYKLFKPKTWYLEMTSPKDSELYPKGALLIRRK